MEGEGGTIYYTSPDVTGVIVLTSSVCLCVRVSLPAERTDTPFQVISHLSALACVLPLGRRPNLKTCFVAHDSYDTFAALGQKHIASIHVIDSASSTCRDKFIMLLKENR